MTLRCTIGLAILICIAGCTFDDPNANEKIRYQMAKMHAISELERVHADLEDYDLMVFHRRHYDQESREVHHYELYDYLKTSSGAGPVRFVVAYDNVTRQTYLRSDLRSNSNIDRLPGD